MIDLSGELAAAERIALSIDTSNRAKAISLATMAREAGILVVKEGLELSSTPGLGWEFCADNAYQNGLDWIADAKLHDIPNTVNGTVENLLSLHHPPIAITIHAASGIEAMGLAQETVANSGVVLLGVTELTSKQESELKASTGFLLEKLGLMPEEHVWEDLAIRKHLVHMRAHDADLAGIGGLVASALELKDPIKSDPNLLGKVTLIPGTRSAGEDTHDQKNVATPRQAMIDGATILVGGRQITQSKNPVQATEKLVAEIQQGLDERNVA